MWNTQVLDMSAYPIYVCTNMTLTVVLMLFHVCLTNIQNIITNLLPSHPSGLLSTQMWLHCQYQFMIIFDWFKTRQRMSVKCAYIQFPSKHILHPSTSAFHKLFQTRKILKGSREWECHTALLVKGKSKNEQKLFYKDHIFLAISLSSSGSLHVHMFSYPQARDELFFTSFIRLL